jgi:hypothetical protein
MSGKFFAALLVLALAGCKTVEGTLAKQLPSRTDISLNQVPVLDATLIPSNNGLLSSGINIVPGSYCLAGSNGTCDASTLSPAQCLMQGSTVVVAPKTNPTPSYDSLIDNKYTATVGGVPFISATASAEALDEVKAVIAGTAQISSTSPNNGYPGIDGLKACILKNQGPGTYDTVYWISAANIIDVTLNHYVQVSSTDGVTVSGFGVNGSTYNHNGVTEERIWIGLQASAIHIGQVSAGTPPVKERPLEPRPPVATKAFVN